MITFLLACLCLILGYIFYGAIVEKIWHPTGKTTPAMAHPDGVDYVPLPTYKAFLIQFLNIAGLGPVFGALLGAVYGPACFLWIVFGCIFAGAVHDYLSGMLSLKHDGKSIIHLMGIYFGPHAKYAGSVLVLAILILVGCVFATSPAQMLSYHTGLAAWIWLLAIFGYYFIATLLPIDKLIGHIYPFFAAGLIIGSVALISALYIEGADMWIPFDLVDHHPKGLPMFPLMFVTVACGAISGFHTTQSPMIARCLQQEKHGRLIFYGAMILEGIIALIWATLGMSFFPNSPALFADIQEVHIPGVVSHISQGLLGNVGGVFIVLTVVILAITTGDTCFRSARLSLADCLHMEQNNMAKRLLLTTCVLGAGIAISVIDVSTIWLYFGCVNQTLATVTLWLVTIYLYKAHKLFWVSLLPAVFMTAVISTYLVYDKLFFNQPIEVARIAGATIAICVLIAFFIHPPKRDKA